MHHAPIPRTLLSVLALSALAACGGGGTSGDDEVLSTDTATGYSANATLAANDATTAFDTAVLAAQSVVAAQAAAASGHESAQGVSASAVADVTVSCPGGGSALLGITGGTASSVLNGQLDTGEVYTLAYTDCRGALGAAAVNGSLSMTVLQADATTLSIASTANALSVALPRGSVTLDGSTARTVSSTSDGNGTTVLASHFTSPSLSLTTHFNARTSVFTLSAADITRQATLLNGVLQGSSIDGTHTLSATLPNGAFSYTVATQGSVSYSATGLPVAGGWTITLPHARVGIAIADGFATISVDQGKDGTIDRSVTVPVSRLASDAG